MTKPSNGTVLLFTFSAAWGSHNRHRLSDSEDLMEKQELFDSTAYWSTEPVSHHGSCLFIQEYVTPDRRVFMAPAELLPIDGDNGKSWFHASPEECCCNHPFQWVGLDDNGKLGNAGPGTGIEGLILVCIGCGLDGT